MAGHRIYKIQTNRSPEEVLEELVSVVDDADRGQAKLRIAIPTGEDGVYLLVAK